jgi:NitT/TauT family transport system permease protein
MKWIQSWISPLLLLAAWEMTVRFGFVDGEFLPPPSEIWAALRQFGPDELLPELAATLWRIAIGLGFAAIIGVVLGSWMAVDKRVDNFFYPILGSTYAIPKSAFVPLFILWFGLGFWPIVLVIFIACILPIVVYTYHGVSEVPKLRIWSAESFGVSRSDLFWTVLIPAAMPQILIGTRIAIGFSFTVAIAGEMIVSTSGLGKLIFSYGEGGVYSAMFAVIAVLLVTAFIVDLLFQRFADHHLRWLERSSDSRDNA